MRRPKLTPANEVSQRELAEFFGLSVASVHRLAGEGLMVRVDRGQYNLKASARKYTDHLRSVAANRSSSAAASATIKMKESVAKLNDLKASQLSGELIEVEAIEDLLLRCALMWRAAFLSLPSLIRYSLKLPMISEERLEQVIDARLNELSEEIAGMKWPDPRLTKQANRSAATPRRKEVKRNANVADHA